MKITAKAAVTGAFLAALCGVSFSSSAAPPPALPRNLLLITIDTLRPDRLSCYSPAFLKTPAIDALAAAGVLFERAFAHTPITLPSHANILLGTTPPVHGISDNSKSRVGAEFLTLAEHLKAAGFATGAFVGAFPLDSRFGLDQGFDVYDDLFPSRAANPTAYSERKAEDVLSAARAWLAGRTGKWFCWIHLWDPHAPYRAPEPFASRFKDDPYSGEAAYIDASLGSFFAFLKSKGLWEGTLIALTSDHGEALGEHGEMTHSFFAYNSTLHIPLIFAGPGIPSLRTSQYAGHVDLFPTLCRSLGVAAPAGLQGLPLQPAWEGKTLPPRPIYLEALDAHLNSGCAPLRGYIENGWKFMESPIPELYDLNRDFDEKSNLAPGKDLAPHQQKLSALRSSRESAATPAGARTVDRETRERLRSLGYIVGSGGPVKKTYGVVDDLKRFLPFQQKLERAVVMTSGSEKAAGLALFEELIGERRDFIAAYTFLAQALIADGRSQEALRVLDEGYRANPENYEILKSYGTALLQFGQADPAIGLLEKALMIVDDDPEVWDNLGLAHFNRRDYAKALEYYRKAIDLDSTFAFAYSNLGILYLTRPSEKDQRPTDLREALANLTRAVNLDPSLGLAYRGLGLVYRESGKTAEAITSWEKAAALNPGDGFSVTSLASACLETGQPERARNALESYLRLPDSARSSADSARARELLEKIRK